MIIHNATIIQTEFIQAADGEVTERRPLQIKLDAFTPDEFEKAYRALLDARNEWEAQCQAQSE